MKFLLLMGLLFSFSTQAKQSESYIQGIMGFESGGVNIGFDYESKKSNSIAGYGGYFLFSSEKKGASPQVMSFGVMTKLHFYQDSKFDISFAPGFGISMVEEGSNLDETVLGPIAKFGVLYKFSDKVAFGGEIFKAYNWLSDEMSGTVDFFNLALRLKM